MTPLYEYFAKMADILPMPSDICVTELKEGFSNKTYLLYWNQTPQLVLRRPDIDCFVFYIDRLNEIRVLTFAASSGLSPPIAWHDDTGGLACYFVEQPPLDWAIQHQDKDVIRITEALRKVHRLPVSEHRYSVFNVIEHYLTMIQCQSNLDDSIQIEYDYVFTLFKQLTRPVNLLPEVLCHNDLNPKNILMDNEKLWLIDWEYSGTGDALYDLAVIAKSHNLNKRQIVLSIMTYHPRLPIDRALDVIFNYMNAYSVREMAWLLLKHLTTPADNVLLEHYYHFKTTPSLNPFYLV